MKRTKEEYLKWARCVAQAPENSWAAVNTCQSSIDEIRAYDPGAADIMKELQAVNYARIAASEKLKVYLKTRMDKP